MRVMKTAKKRKVLQIDNRKKMMTTMMVLVLVEVVLVLVLLVVAQAKKRLFEVEIVARALVEVAVWFWREIVGKRVRCVYLSFF